MTFPVSAHGCSMPYVIPLRGRSHFSNEWQRSRRFLLNNTFARFKAVYVCAGMYVWCCERLSPRHATQTSAPVSIYVDKWHIFEVFYCTFEIRQLKVLKIQLV